jgi:aspartyl aminopeptidase
MRVANLAIHLRNADDRNKLDPNKEDHLRPIFSSEVYRQLTHGKKTEEKGSDKPEIATKHYDGLLNLIAKEINHEVSQISDIELNIVDTQPACLLGLDQDFVSSPRLDNLFSSFFALKAILADPTIADNAFIDLICLFDHEEVGSLSAQGADSVMLLQNLNRIFSVLTNGQTPKADSFEKAIQRSFVVSADMAHSVHPNYPEKHQFLHRPLMNSGIVVKTNVNQRYATDGVSCSILRMIAEVAKVPLQVMNDTSTMRGVTLYFCIRCLCSCV